MKDGRTSTTYNTEMGDEKMGYTPFSNFLGIGMFC